MHIVLLTKKHVAISLILLELDTKLFTNARLIVLVYNIFKIRERYMSNNG